LSAHFIQQLTKTANKKFHSPALGLNTHGTHQATYANTRYGKSKRAFFAVLCTQKKKRVCFKRISVYLVRALFVTVQLIRSGKIPPRELIT
jgi:hypothetical protein